MLNKQHDVSLELYSNMGVISQYNNLCKSVCMFEQLCKPVAAADSCSEGFDLSPLPMTQPCRLSAPDPSCSVCFMNVSCILGVPITVRPPPPPYTFTRKTLHSLFCAAIFVSYKRVLYNSPPSRAGRSDHLWGHQRLFRRGLYLHTLIGSPYVQ